MASTIGQQTASYRQGLVLGLTMAEIMLLLVFCLLIAVGVALSKERAELNAAVLQLKQVERSAAADKALVETIRRNTRLTELLDGSSSSASPRDIDDFWRKLVESNDVVANLERQGVSRVGLKDATNEIAKLHGLIGEGIDADKIARALALASAIDATLPARNAAKLTPQEVTALIGKGMALEKPNRESAGTGAHNWPPIIKLSEADGYYFATGKADLTPGFAHELRTAVVDRLLQIASRFDVDVIEVIGHTDEQPISSHASNLDRNLPAATLGLSGPASLQWADNAGLGLARALAVVKVLSADPRLLGFRVLPLSGAQLIDTNDTVTRWDGVSDVRERRRIEIRMRKSM